MGGCPITKLRVGRSSHCKSADARAIRGALAPTARPGRSCAAVHLIHWRRGQSSPSGLLGSVAAVEYELIALAAAQYPVELLNTQGR